MEPFSIQGDNVDVSKIMKAIQERVKKKKERGIYTDEELEEVTRLRLETLADEVDIDSTLIEHLRNEHAIWNISPNYSIKSHRKGLGFPITMLKKLVRPFVRLYTDQIINRQAQLNLYTIHILHNLVQEITKQQIENRKLKSRIERLEKSRRMNHRRQKSYDKTSSSGGHNNHGRKKRAAPKKN